MFWRSGVRESDCIDCGEADFLHFGGCEVDNAVEGYGRHYVNEEAA